MPAFSLMYWRQNQVDYGERGIVVGLRHYATSWKVADSSPDEVIEYFAIYLILPAAVGPGVYSAPNKNEYYKQRKYVSME
jgi:hypothetical protein